MSVRDNLTAGKYHNTVPYSVDPTPVDEDQVTISQSREILLSDKRRAKDQKVAHKLEDCRLSRLLQSDLEKENGVSGHPRAAMLWEKAWERGHAYGYSDVISVYEDLVELIK